MSEWTTESQTTLGESVENDDDWNGMPEFVQDNIGACRKIIVSFKTEEDVKKFSELLDQRITDKTKSLWYPAQEKSAKLFKWIDNES